MEQLEGENIELNMDIEIAALPLKCSFQNFTDHTGSVARRGFRSRTLGPRARLISNADSIIPLFVTCFSNSFYQKIDEEVTDARTTTSVDLWDVLFCFVQCHA